MSVIHLIVAFAHKHSLVDGEDKWEDGEDEKNSLAGNTYTHFCEYFV